MYSLFGGIVAPGLGVIFFCRESLTCDICASPIYEWYCVASSFVANDNIARAEYGDGSAHIVVRCSKPHQRGAPTKVSARTA